MKATVQCAACFQIVDVDPHEHGGTLHRCNGKDKRVYAELQDQPFYKELRIEPIKQQKASK